VSRRTADLNIEGRARIARVSRRSSSFAPPTSDPGATLERALVALVPPTMFAVSCAALVVVMTAGVVFPI